VLRASADRILASLPGDAVVLDVGGWAQPFGRADWVIDLQPHVSRGLYGHDPGAPLGGAERFTRDTWVQRDICDHEPWPFADGQFDYAVCSHTLEDLRDPVSVCAELNRVARAGYVEVPSRLEEQSWGVHGPWVGWTHHHWLCDVEDGAIEFVFKPHLIHARESDHFGGGFATALSSEQRVLQLWWEGGFRYRERVMLESAELDDYLADFVTANRHLGPEVRTRGVLERVLSRGRRGAGAPRSTGLRRRGV